MAKKMADESQHFHRLAILVAGGATVRGAAASLGVSERQAYRITAQPEFQDEVAALRAESVSRAVGLLAEVASEAVECLRSVAADQSADATVRVRAANDLLSQLRAMQEHFDFARRLERLENAKQIRVAS